MKSIFMHETTPLYKGHDADDNLINRFIIECPLLYDFAAGGFALEKVSSSPIIQVHHANTRNRDVVEFEPSLCPRLK
jgi:hypothetical protein